jgi:adenylate kinase family enzyme
VAAGSVPSADMDRVAIIGCGGSGKTTVARRLGQILHAPVTHLDVLYYNNEWNTLPADAFAAVQTELVAAPRWVIDGNFAGTLPIRLAAGATVIFLDIPPIVCLWGIAQRRLRHGGGQHDTTGVYDRITWQFVRYVLGYRRTMRPRVRQLIAQHAAHAEIHHVGSRRAARALITEIATRHATPRR